MGDLLKNKVIVVSGGTKGTGKGIVIGAAREGAKVVIGGRDREAAERILEQVRDAGSEGIFVYTDLNRAEDCAKLMDEAVAAYGRLDGLVNYAGLTPACDMANGTPELFDTIFNINIRAAYFCTQRAIHYMQKFGGGSIIMVGSVHAWCGEKDRSIYACSKGALLTLCEHVAHHYAVDQIRCNMVTSGWVPTEGEVALRAKQGMNIDQLREFAKPFMPMGRMQEVEDQVPGYLYLLSDYASQVTGSNIRMAGGQYVG